MKKDGEDKEIKVVEIKDGRRDARGGVLLTRGYGAGVDGWWGLVVRDSSGRCHDGMAGFKRFKDDKMDGWLEKVRRCLVGNWIHQLVNGTCSA